MWHFCGYLFSARVNFLSINYLRLTNKWPCCAINPAIIKVIDSYPVEPN
jgi:hypothetical protein